MPITQKNSRPLDLPAGTRTASGRASILVMKSRGSSADPIADIARAHQRAEQQARDAALIAFEIEFGEKPVWTRTNFVGGHMTTTVVYEIWELPEATYDD